MVGVLCRSRSNTISSSVDMRLLVADGPFSGEGIVKGASTSASICLSGWVNGASIKAVV